MAMTPREELAWALFECIDEAPEDFRSKLAQALRAYAERYPVGWSRMKRGRGLLRDVLESIAEGCCFDEQDDNTVPTGARAE
jgi:hypothetical protein